MDISPKQLYEAIEQIAYEKKIPPERILETVEAALAAAYRKDFGHPEQIVRAKLNPETGETEIYVVYAIVAEVENPHTEITVAEAKKRGKKDAKVEEELIEQVAPPEEYGRIAAQTAKQVIIQRIREVEREIVQEEFSDRVGELMTGSVQRIEGRNVFVEVGRAIGIMQPVDQISAERYYIGQRLRVMLREVDSEGRGAQLILTRAHPDFVRRLFELEVPEIHAGTVEIRSVAREAGVRSKVAVHSNQEGVDPVGTCVGQRGTRVQAIMAELGEEKIDIVLFDEDSDTYIRNAMSPAKISKITLHEDTKTADIQVADDQLSLAIGRGGQNVRLAGELTGWQLDIEKNDLPPGDGEAVVSGIPVGQVADVSEDEAKAFVAAGLKTAQQIAAAPDEELAKVEGVDESRRKEIITAAATAVSESGDEADPQEESESETPTDDAAEATAPESPPEATADAAADAPATVEATPEETAADPSSEDDAGEAESKDASLDGAEASPKTTTESSTEDAPATGESAPEAAAEADQAPDKEA